MNLKASMCQLAERIDGRFVEYSNDTNIILIPIDRSHCQAVISQLVHKNGEIVVEFSSKAGELNAGKENHQVILKINQELFYSKVVIQEWQLNVSAEVLLSNCTDQLIKDVILEVATLAHHLDHQEVTSTIEVEKV
ncbi:MAG: hypothetical protein V4714_01385 [Bacteroidota bacterium]